MRLAVRVRAKMPPAVEAPKVMQLAASLKWVQLSVGGLAFFSLARARAGGSNFNVPPSVPLLSFSLSVHLC